MVDLEVLIKNTIYICKSFIKNIKKDLSDFERWWYGVESNMDYYWTFKYRGDLIIFKLKKILKPPKNIEEVPEVAKSINLRKVYVGGDHWIEIPEDLYEKMWPSKNKNEQSVNSEIVTEPLDNIAHFRKNLELYLRRNEKPSSIKINKQTEDTFPKRPDYNDLLIKVPEKATPPKVPETIDQSKMNLPKQLFEKSDFKKQPFMDSVYEETIKKGVSSDDTSSLFSPTFFEGINYSDLIALKETNTLLSLWYSEWKDWIYLNENPYFTNFDIVIMSLISIIFPLFGVAYFTLAERKVMASIQRRKGPNIVGFWGLLQPIADGLKLLSKEIIIPTKANKFLFFLSPFISFFTSLLSWIFIPIDVFNCICLNNYSLLFIMILSPLSVYGVLLAGIGSNSKYAMLAAIRTAAQMVSYEIPIGLCYLIVMAVTGTANVQGIIFYQMESCSLIFFLLPIGIIYFILCLAETNRAPFDLPEAEAELVAGYNVEYSGFPFAAFFLGEYFNILTMSAMFTTLFLSGWSCFFYYIMPGFLLFELSLIIFFSFKVVLVAFFFIFVRANLPRYRFDHLMEICWKIFIPVLLALFIFYSSVVFTADIAIEQLPPCVVQKLSKF